MGANENVDFAPGCPLQRFELLFLRGKPADRCDFEGKLGHPFAERATVLFSQHGGGYQYGDLVANVDGLESTPNRNLRFSEANITTEQSVHGFGLLHIRFDVLNSV